MNVTAAFRAAVFSVAYMQATVAVNRLIKVAKYNEALKVTIAQSGDVFCFCIASRTPSMSLLKY